MSLRRTWDFLKCHVPLLGHATRFVRRSVLLHSLWRRQRRDPRAERFLLGVTDREIAELQDLHDASERAHLVRRFLNSPAWDSHSVSPKDRWKTYRRLVDCHTQIQSASDVWRSLLYFTEILAVPPSVSGEVIECGCFQGASTACLSIACKISGRRLLVCDSFEGLPPPQEEDRFHQALMLRDVLREYRPGEYRGTLNQVRANIERWGEVDVCQFVPGWFRDSLTELAAREKHDFVFALLDVDLFESNEQCLRYLWPRLRPGCKLYTDDGGELDIAAMFFEREWWKATFGEDPPGLYGAGFGINLFQGQYSAVGLAVKGNHLASDRMAAILQRGNP